jgi:hypothetical protein
MLIEPAGISPTPFAGLEGMPFGHAAPPGWRAGGTV